MGGEVKRKGVWGGGGEVKRKGAREGVKRKRVCVGGER